MKIKFAKNSCVKEAAAGDRKVSFVLSDGSIDRDGDELNPKGWATDNYLAAGGPVLFGHKTDNPDNIVGKMVNIWFEENQMCGTVEFLPADVNPNADKVYKTILAGALGACSVGFIPFGMKRKPTGGVVVAKQELVEVSIVPVPANANCLVLAKEFGIAEEIFKELQECVVEQKDLFSVRFLGSIVEDLALLYKYELCDGEDSSGAVEQCRAALVGLGQALVKLTAEEVGEILADVGATEEAKGLEEITIKDEKDLRLEKLVKLRKMLGVSDLGVIGALDTLLKKHNEGKRITISVEGDKAAFGQKAGRVLSQANENRVRAACDALNQVLAEMETETGDSGEAACKPDGTKAERLMRAKLLREKISQTEK